MNAPDLERWARDTFARRDEVMTREEMRKLLEGFAARIVALEEWKSNILGRFVAFGVIGAIFVAVTSVVITRLIFGP